MDSINVIHFHNGTGGGVWTVIKNLVSFQQDQRIKNHILFYFRKSQQISIELQELPRSVKTTTYIFREGDNFFHTCSRLAKLISDEKAVLIAHDWLELGMISQLGLPNPLIYYAHGDYDYYYDLAQKHQHVIDACITVSQAQAKKMKLCVPVLAEKTRCIYFPVPAAAASNPKVKGSVIFIGRLSDTKGYDVLVQMAQKLSAEVKLNWHVIGEGEPAYLEKIKWPDDVDVKHYGQLANKEVQNILSKMEILVLPSMREGMPNVVIEAMKAAVVPLVSNIEGGVQELIENGETGFLIPQGEGDKFADRIRELQNGTDMERIAMQAKTRADQLFDPVKNVSAFEKFVLDVAAIQPAEKLKKKIYGSRLDEKWIPNFVTRILRSVGTQKKMNFSR